MGRQVGAGSRQEAPVLWTLTVLPECPHDMVLASLRTSKSREKGRSGNAVYDLVSEVHALYIQMNIMQP